MSRLSSQGAFSQAAQLAAPEKPRKKKRPAPLSIRISDEEREQLKTEAAGASVHGYVRDCLFGAAASKHSRVRRPASVDHAALARILGTLGQSRLSSNLNQLAKSANMGALPVTPELSQELHNACADIATMRQDLMRALGLKPEA